MDVRFVVSVYVDRIDDLPTAYAKLSKVLNSPSDIGRDMRWETEEAHIMNSSTGLFSSVPDELLTEVISKAIEEEENKDETYSVPLEHLAQNPSPGNGQPGKADQVFVVERRLPSGVLDFKGEQPWKNEATLEDLYHWMWSEDDEADGKYDTLKSWLDKKSWFIRPKTW